MPEVAAEIITKLHHLYAFNFHLFQAAISDQLTGLIMWLPVGFVFTLLTIGYFAAWLHALDGHIAGSQHFDRIRKGGMSWRYLLCLWLILSCTGMNRQARYYRKSRMTLVHHNRDKLDN